MWQESPGGLEKFLHCSMDQCDSVSGLAHQWSTGGARNLWSNMHQAWGSSSRANRRPNNTWYLQKHLDQDLSLTIISQNVHISHFSVAKVTLESQMSVCQSVSLLQKPLSLSEFFLSAIEPIDSQAYWPSSLLTIKPINHPPSSLSTIKTINCSSSFATFKPFGLL